MTSKNIARALELASLSLLLAACNPESSEGPKPRSTDPPLTHSWTMPSSAGPVARVDLGTHPEANADAMMEDAKIAGLLHRITTRCAEQDQLPPGGTLVLRFAISEAGALLDAKGDPPSGGECLARELSAETDALKSLPAGAALARLQLHSDASVPEQ
jgi:hypothetical protein